mgnify:CR=1 FL=1
MSTAKRSRLQGLHESRLNASLKLPVLGQLDTGPFAVGWTLEDFQRLNDSKYYWEDTLVRTYTLCLAWALRKLDVTDVLVDGSFGQHAKCGSAPVTEDINILFWPQRF